MTGNFNGALNKLVLDRYGWKLILFSNLFHLKGTFLALWRFLSLDISDCGKSQCMYIWIDGTGENLRAKTKTVDFVPKHPSGNCSSNYTFLGKYKLLLCLLSSDYLCQKDRSLNFFISVWPKTYLLITKFFQTLVYNSQEKVFLH